MGIRRLLPLAVLGAAAVLAPAADAGADACPSGRSCYELSVPLDRSGEAPGTVRLWVERVPARRASRPPLFVLARGPGMSSTWFFGDDRIRWLFPRVRRERDIVVLDLRGTGRSSPLVCPALQEPPPAYWSTTDIAECGASLGPRSAFHSATDSAADIEAVRSLLGVDEIALFGDVDGADAALAYARDHPGRVERLLLQSPRSLDAYDALRRESLQTVPRILDEICGEGACRSSTPDAAADLRELVARLEEEPLTGFAIDDAGQGQPLAIAGQGLLSVFRAAEFDRTVLAMLPGALRNALRGDPLPLLRLSVHDGTDGEWRKSVRQMSFAANLAARCGERGLPWTSVTPFAERMPRAEWLAQGLSPGALGPFGLRTAFGGVIEHCAAWPAAPDPEPAALRPLPAVPTLIVAGGQSVTAPVEVARQVAAAIPGAHLLEVPGDGFDVLEEDREGCERAVVASFLVGGGPSPDRPWQCPGEGVEIRPVDPVPLSLDDLEPAGGSGTGDAGRTLAAVRRTIQDGFATLYREVMRRSPDGVVQGRTSVGALRAGTYELGDRELDADRRVRLHAASLIEGVRVTGWMSPYDSDLSESRGSFVVEGDAASPGRLILRHGVLSGQLGGREVEGELTMEFADVVGLAGG